MKTVKILQDESKTLVISLIILYIVIQIVFYKESILINIRTALSFFWIFILPGYFLMLYWHKKLHIIERIIIGTILSACVTGIVSYYVGLIGINVNYHAFLLPLLLIGLGVLIKK